MSELFELFAPGLRYLREERQRRQIVAQQAGSSAPPFDIDLDAGIARLGVDRSHEEGLSTEPAPTGLTKDAGWQVGVSRTIGAPIAEVWEHLLGAGRSTWLGPGGYELRVGQAYLTSDGTTGEVRSLRRLDRVRLTRRLAGQAHDTTLQVALRAIAVDKTMLRFHSERLRSPAEREEQRAHWAAVLLALLQQLDAAS